jgi:hypothetical protein
MKKVSPEIVEDKKDKNILIITKTEKKEDNLKPEKKKDPEKNEDNLNPEKKDFLKFEKNQNNVKNENIMEIKKKDDKNKIVEPKIVEFVQKEEIKKFNEENLLNNQEIELKKKTFIIIWMDYILNFVLNINYFNLIKIFFLKFLEIIKKIFIFTIKYFFNGVILLGFVSFLVYHEQSENQRIDSNKNYKAQLSEQKKINLFQYPVIDIPEFYRYNSKNFFLKKIENFIEIKNEIIEENILNLNKMSFNSFFYGKNGIGNFKFYNLKKF